MSDVEAPKHLVVYPSDDIKVRVFVCKWIRSAGGSISLRELEEKLRGQFEYQCLTPSSFTEEQWNKLEEKPTSYKLQDGRVSIWPSSPEHKAPTDC